MDAAEGEPAPAEEEAAASEEPAAAAATPAEDAEKEEEAAAAAAADAAEEEGARQKEEEEEGGVSKAKLIAMAATIGLDEELLVRERGAQPFAALLLSFAAFLPSFHRLPPRVLLPFTVLPPSFAAFRRRSRRGFCCSGTTLFRCLSLSFRCLVSCLHRITPPPFHRIFRRTSAVPSVLSPPVPAAGRDARGLRGRAGLQRADPPDANHAGERKGQQHLDERQPFWLYNSAFRPCLSSLRQQHLTERRAFLRLKQRLSSIEAGGALMFSACLPCREPMTWEPRRRPTTACNSRRRVFCHSAAPPSAASRRLNTNGESASAPPLCPSLLPPLAPPAPVLLLLSLLSSLPLASLSPLFSSVCLRPSPRHDRSLWPIAPKACRPSIETPLNDSLLVPTAQ